MALPVLVLLALIFTLTLLSQPTLSIALSLQRRHRPSLVHGTPCARQWTSIYTAPRSTPPRSGLSVGNVIGDAEGDSAVNGDSFHASELPSPPPRSTPFPVVLWRFTRPHTLIGSALAVPSLFLLAAPTYRAFFTRRTFAVLFYTTIPALLMNVYITGLNQITDVEIDKINKPDLPMAAGDLNYATATAVVLSCMVVSLAMSVLHPLLRTSGLQVALWGSFLLGTLYSLPPFRMKKHPLLAAFCIVAVRGTIINAGFYSHALSAAFGSAALSSAGVWSCLRHDPLCLSSSAFFCVFGIVIALMKDIPDMHGDRVFGIRSFTVRLGQTRVFGATKNLLTALFGCFGGLLLRSSAVATTLPATVRRGVVGATCWAAAWSLNSKARGINPEDSGEVYNYYMFLWKLFYLSYLVLPLVK